MTDIETPKKLANAQYTIWDVYGQGWNTQTGSDTWSPEEIDKLETLDHKEFHKITNQCRFYYRRDPIAGTVINKMVDIGITDIILEKKTLSANEFRIFQGIKDSIQEFIESCALEYLISGLVIPEIKYAAVPKDKLEDLGIKKYTTLTLPVAMWLRDPKTIKINSTMVADKPSYYAIIPEELIFFIKNRGIYPDGTKDFELYTKLLQYYPEFVAQVMAGAKEVLLENDLIIRRKPLTDCPYPTPYLYSAVEALKHKRNLRRMDYSIASRVISAIMLIKLGNDEYPVTEDDSTAFDAIKSQMSYRNSAGKYIDRIFQLFANHTLSIEWVFPDVSALLNEAKYREVNQDIFFALGFPRILTTGETERTQTSDPEFATLSPIKTMESMRRKLLPIVNDILEEVAELNGLKVYPTARFKSMNLYAFSNFVQAMSSVYNSGNISRTTYDELFGFNWEEEMNQKIEENKIMEDSELPEFQQLPFSNQPNVPGQQPNQPNNPAKKPVPKKNSDNKE